MTQYYFRNFWYTLICVSWRYATPLIDFRRLHSLPATLTSGTRKTMSLIHNLVKEPEKHEIKSKKPENDKDEDPKPRPIIKSALDLQRLKLEKLMKNPEKPVVIPEHRREKDYMQQVPSFVRNVMGSSAGAGSGEFHVYRHLRRKEYARQKMIQHKSVQEQLDDDYQNKLEENLRISEEKTAKKRAKRLKKKHRAKKPRQHKKTADESDKGNEDNDSSSDSNVEGVELKSVPPKNDDTNLTPESADADVHSMRDIDITTNAEDASIPINNKSEDKYISTEEGTNNEDGVHESKKC